MIWQASYSPFGQATVNGDPDGDSVFYVQNIRLPGQYYDAETGLHYNYQRDYNPRSGRYLTGDPLGFGGGSLNLYAYCAGDPINWVDPTGQNAAVIGGIARVSVLFIPYSVRAAAVAALLAIMPQSEHNFIMAFTAFMVFFAILHYEHMTFEWGRPGGKAGTPTPGPIPAPAVQAAASGTGGGEGPDAGNMSGESTPASPSPGDDGDEGKGPKQAKKQDSKYLKKQGLDPHDFKDAYGADSKSDIYVDKDGNLWIGPHGKGGNQPWIRTSENIKDYSGGVR